MHQSAELGHWYRDGIGTTDCTEGLHEMGTYEILNEWMIGSPLRIPKIIIF